MKCHQNLKIYDLVIPAKDWVFTHQEWNVQFQNILLEHHSEEIVGDAIQELGTKIWTNPPDRKLTYGSMISARINIDLSKPLHRGVWWNTAAGGVTWIPFHWERQPHNLCPKCFFIDHKEEECLSVADDLITRRFTNEQYFAYLHEIDEAYRVEIIDDLDLLVQRISKVAIKLKEEEAMKEVEKQEE